MKQTLLWLDDMRNPFNKKDWLRFSPIGDNVTIHWVKSYKQFVNWITIYGLPDAICFDYDLGNRIDQFPDGRRTGYDCAEWLCQYCKLNNKPLPKYAIQSANKNGKIKLNNLLKTCQNTI